MEEPIVEGAKLAMDWTGVDLSGVGTAIVDGMKVGIPVALSILGIKKGAATVMGWIRKA